MLLLKNCMSSIYYRVKACLLNSFHMRPSLRAQLVKNPPAMEKTPVWIPGLEKFTGERIGYPLQYSWALLVAQLVKNPPAMQETWFDPWVGKIPWRREQLPTPVPWSGEFLRLHSPWGQKESDTEWLSLSHSPQNNTFWEFKPAFYLLLLSTRDSECLLD